VLHFNKFIRLTRKWLTVWHQLYHLFIIVGSFKLSLNILSYFCWQLIFFCCFGGGRGVFLAHPVCRFIFRWVLPWIRVYAAAVIILYFLWLSWIISDFIFYAPSPLERCWRHSVIGQSVRASVCDHIPTFINTIFYKPRVGISPNL